MSYRLSKIYTRKGDHGYTTLGKQRLSKDDPLVEAVGTLDELNAVLGWVLSQPIQEQEIKVFFTRVQHALFDMGGELHLPQYPRITSEKVQQLEQQLDQWNHSLPPLKEFLLPRGNAAAAACHVARTVCRRAERALVHLHRQAPLANPQLLCYLNRLSDILFVIARILTRQDSEQEILWEQDRKSE